MSGVILLPEHRADPTRGRRIVRARPEDVALEAKRARHDAHAAALLHRARARYGFAEGFQAGNQTNQWVEPIWSNTADGPQVISAAAETALLNSTTGQPWFWPGFWGVKTASGKVVDIEATGVLQTTGTPTFTFFVRLGSTQNVITGTVIAQTAGLVMVSGAASAGTYWEMRCRIFCQTPGIGSGAATITSSGIILCSGFPSPFFAQMEVSTPPNATWTTTLDGSLSQYLMLSMNPGTSSASNNCTLKTLRVFATTY